jgi:hypothetical protein
MSDQPLPEHGPDLHRQFELTTQWPKPQVLGLGVLAVDKHGDAQFFSGEGERDSTVLAVMKRSRLDSASAHGLMLSGMEPTGMDRRGRETFAYQEWWLRYPPKERG